MVRSLDELIDYQRYPIIAAEIYTKSQRTLGIGIINYAYYLAKNKAAWDSEEARKLTHQMAEKFQYSLLKASNNLAKEKGACPEFNTSKYFDGILPIDTYSKFVDTFAKFEYECDWETLRESIKQYGLRNNALSALMPSESSSVVSNATNGIEPPRELLTVKRNQKGDMKMIVPGYSKFKNYYELLFDMKSPKPYLTNLAIIQKFVDQSISTNISYNPEHYENFEIPMSVLISDLIYSQKCGIKTLYYNNTYDMDENDVQEVKSGCESGACVL
jgi:ribonucleoside-diphosphate reductase alpha chain